MYCYLKLCTGSSLLRYLRLTFKLCLCQQRLLLFGKKGLGDTKVKERRVVLFLELDMIVMHAAALAALADIPPTFHI